MNKNPLVYGEEKVSEGITDVYFELNALIRLSDKKESKNAIKRELKRIGSADNNVMRVILEKKLFDELGGHVEFSTLDYSNEKTGLYIDYTVKGNYLETCFVTERFDENGYSLDMKLGSNTDKLANTLMKYITKKNEEAKLVTATLDTNFRSFIKDLNL